MPQLLIELFSEEIPARMQSQGSAALRDLICGSLKEASLSFDTCASYATPRRITLVVDGLPHAQPDIKEERRGPRRDAPVNALEGFLKANNLTREECEIRTAGKGEFWFATIDKKGRTTCDLIKEILPSVISKFPWQKSMRWGKGSLRWVRPLKNVMCILDGEPVPIELENDVSSIGQSWGHRFYSPNPFGVKFFDDYEKSLNQARVILDTERRQKTILEGAEKLVSVFGCSIVSDPALLSEVSGLVEWPVPMLGRIDPEFMDLPDEVLMTSMKSHQKYFSVKKNDGGLAPYFVVVANIDPDDGSKAVVSGNERVLRARLSDAKFFWDQDRRQKLETLLPRLNGMIFHEKLGSLSNKVKRLEGLALALSPLLDADAEKAKKAAQLCKADLVSGMVGEFASLQGIMGRYYALAGGEHEDVAGAIAEHYSPAGPNDACPNDRISLTISISDKLDTLVGFFGVNEKPTGSRDPFGLRRAALGIIRMILENKLRLPLNEIFLMAREQYRKPAADGEILAQFSETNDDGTCKDLLSFFSDRLKVHLRSQGVRHDLIDAVFALKNEDDLFRIVSRVNALQSFLDTEDGKNLLAGYRRATNIVEIEEKKEGISFDGPITSEVLVETSERSLAEEIEKAAVAVDQALLNEDFTTAMAHMSGLREPVDLFFDNVTVNADQKNIRENRLRLLSSFRSLLGRVASFGKIEG